MSNLLSPIHYCKVNHTLFICRSSCLIGSYRDLQNIFLLSHLLNNLNSYVYIKCSNPYKIRNTSITLILFHSTHFKILINLSKLLSPIHYCKVNHTLFICRSSCLIGSYRDLENIFLLFHLLNNLNSYVYIKCSNPYKIRNTSITLILFHSTHFKILINLSNLLLPIYYCKVNYIRFICICSYFISS
ncbi:hypothetical protein Erum1230 [Ehrlichia ruminantium str. Welgevonden]|nr:hypothetical protein Erum1230 [Ehrlichia ruminantium str. Welgevonden]